MNILITGGRGFIGSALTQELKSSGHSVVITTRDGSDLRDNEMGILRWKAPELIPTDIISSMDVVINLAGESIASGRWTPERKKCIRSSRIDTTRAVIQSIRIAEPKPKLLISASAVGYYGPHGYDEVTEDTPCGDDFLSDVAREWEKEALKAEESGVRVVIIRLGVVLGDGGGALDKMTTTFRAFLGGYIGDGRQWFPWIHRDDVTGIIMYALKKESISGPVNAVAPQQITNKEFSSALGTALHRPSLLPVPGFVLKAVLGEMADMLLTGQRVSSEKIMKTGYMFKYPEIDGALKSIFSNK